jgi:hypothetical protein
MLHSPFKIFLASFGSVDFSFGSFVAGLPESMRQDQSPTDEEKAQDSIGLDLELKDLVRFGQMFELAFIPNLPLISHARKRAAHFCRPPRGSCSSHASAGAARFGAT